MTHYIGRNGIQRGGAIRREIIGIPSNKTEEKKPRNYAGVKKFAKNAGIAVASIAAVGGLAMGAHSLYRRYDMRQLYNNALIMNPADPLGENIALRLGGLIEVPAFGDDIDLLDFRRAVPPIEEDSDDDEPLIEGMPPDVPRRSTMIDLLPSGLSEEESDIDVALIEPARPPQSALPPPSLSGVVDVAQNPQPSRVSELMRLARNLVGERPREIEINPLITDLLQQLKAGKRNTVIRMLQGLPNETIDEISAQLNNRGIITELERLEFNRDMILSLASNISSEQLFRDA